MYEITIKQMILKKVPAGEVWKVVRDELFTEEDAQGLLNYILDLTNKCP